MKKNNTILGSDFAKVDAHVIQPDEYAESPELTEEWFNKADFYHGETLIRRGRPPRAERKQMISFRFAPDLLAAIRATGKGYNSRIENILRKALDAGQI